MLLKSGFLVPSIGLWLKRSGLSVAGLTAAESESLHAALSAVGNFWIRAGIKSFASSCMCQRITKSS